MAQRPSKLAQVRAAMRVGDWRRALSIAAKFEELGPQRTAIIRAHEAYEHPRFYEQLGTDLASLKSEGKRALIDCYGKELVVIWPRLQVSALICFHATSAFDPKRTPANKQKPRERGVSIVLPWESASKMPSRS